MVLARAEYTISTLFDGENFYRAYADSADGSLRFSETDSNRLYLGTYVGRTKPTNPSQYQWSLIKGRDSDAVIKITTPSYPLTTPYTQQNGIVFPTIYGNTKHSVPVGDGRNLLKGSKPATPISNTQYPITRFDLATKPIVGKTYTFIMKGTLGADKGYFAIYNSGGYVILGALTKDGNYYVGTFTWRNTYGAYTASDTNINVYPVPHTVISTSTVEWAMLVEGNMDTKEWYPAPEDTSQNLLSVGNEVELVSSVGRPNILNHFSGTYSGNNITSSIDSNKNLVIDISSTSNGNYVSFSANPINDEEFQKIKSGTLVTFSIDIKGEKLSSSIAPRFYYGQNMGYYRMIGSVSSEFSRVYITREWSATSLSPHLGFNGMSGRYIIKNAKLEIAAGPSPYSLSPTDISYDIPHPTIYKTNLTLPQPLRSVGEVKDKLFKDNDGVWKIERKIGERVINTTNFAFSTNTPTQGNNYYFNGSVCFLLAPRTALGIVKNTRDDKLICDRYPYTNTNNYNNQNAVADTIHIIPGEDNRLFLRLSESVIGGNGSETQAALLSKFATYINTNPVTINYQLATPIIEVLDKPLQDKLNSLSTYSPETWVYTVNNGKTYLGEEVVPEMEGEFWGAGWAANFRIENNIIPNIDNKANNSDLNSTIQTITEESEKIASLRTDVDITKNNFLITHTDEYVNKITTTESSLDGLDARVVSVEETKENIDTFFQFDDAFTIGKSNAQTKLRLTNDEIQFLDGETKGTYITGNTMVSQNIQIQDGFNLPKHTMETEGDITVIRFTG